VIGDRLPATESAIDDLRSRWAISDRWPIANRKTAISIADRQSRQPDGR
jgi:hypothetical protein